MIIVMQAEATQSHLDHVVARVESLGLRPHVIVGTERTVVAVVVAGVPLLLRTDQIIKVSAIVVYSLIGLSLVVLTGWAGQVSLGQFGFVAIGAAVSARNSPSPAE